MIETKLLYGILHVTLSRAERRNAISREMFDTLADTLLAAAEDPKTRVVLLKAAGSVFSAGADLQEVLSDEAGMAAAEDRFFRALREFPKPVIAEVNGACVGAAFITLLYCDLVYAGTHALFSLPAVALARTPKFGAAAVIEAAAGYPKAAEKLLLSEPISADEAEAMRLITRVVEDEHLESVVAAKTARLAVLPPGAVSGMKRLLGAARADAAERFAGLETELHARQAVSPEAAEALRAFLEGRKPVFQPEE
ncbi:enoyl-CoA hydratase-related protein [Sutterella sp.]|uniref:enoyl-CoA hydratase-related protein n=1 Tax=Sutterella sp. TaxID=1981025 RepID=UPI0026DF6D20|nr:enoyl-CoA hydratase-related protein [Sutterella sp.]MDO5530697.1 enoyl-CoA hydratase-related protein [Sutterella sp.]